MTLKLLLTLPIFHTVFAMFHRGPDQPGRQVKEIVLGVMLIILCQSNRSKIDEVFSVEKCLLLRALALAQKTLHFDNPSDL